MKKFKTFTISFIVLAVLVTAQRFGYLRPAEDISLKILTPIGRVLNISTNTGKGIFGNIRGLRDLQKENKGLKEKLNQTEQEIISLQEAKKENDSLRKDLEFKIDSGYKTISAEVSMYSPSNVRQTILIDKGEKDGIKKGMTVVSEGFLVGQIFGVNEDTSKVFIITDPVSAIPVYVQNTTATGIVKGQIGYGLSLEEVPQGDILGQGQFVVTSGLGGEYRKGLILGKIDKIEKSDNTIFQSASVRPEVNFSRIERVLVIK